MININGGLNMNESLGFKKVILIGVMLFALFFGAGNLIFPPFLGQEAGVNTLLGMVGFILSAVCFPILGVLVISKTNGLKNLALRVGPSFSLVFTILIYLSIGPLLGIPRAGSLPYEMVLSPFIKGSGSIHRLALAGFTTLFFLCTYYLAMNPTKLIDRLGKVLTPILLALIVLVFLKSFSVDFKLPNTAQEMYASSPVITGFLEGYQTMDTIAALNFGLVISTVIKNMGIKDDKKVLNISIKAGLIAGVLLIFIYSILAYLGSLSGAQFGMTENGAQTLTNIFVHVFGDSGLLLLATVFTLACLTTATGLVSSISQYFSSITKLTYKTWIRIIVLWSFAIANFGLTKILKLSIPILNIIYPLALVLIVLALFDRFFSKDSLIYRKAISLTVLLSIIQFVDAINLFPNQVFAVFRILPFYNMGLGWVLPVLIFSILIMAHESLKKA